MGSDPTRRRFLGAVGALLGSGTLAGCGAPSEGGDNGDGESGATTVELTDGLVFEPARVTIAPGETVVWENVGTVDHTVTAYDDQIPDGAAYFATGDFDDEQAARDAYPDGAIGGGETFEHTFDTEGTYEYFCVPHEGSGMTGTVEVG